MKKKLHPPFWIDRFLQWRLPEEQFEEVQGDMHELYKHWLEETGERKARLKYLLNAFAFLRPLPKRKASLHSKKNQYSPIKPFNMFQHNLLITLRNFKKSKSTFFINLIGLSTGLACALFIYLWVSDEKSIDKFHEKDERLYHVMNNMKTSQKILTLDKTPAPLAKALVEEMPQVEYAVAVNDFFSWRNREGILIEGNKHIKATGLHASKDYFHVFSYNLIEGDKNLVLADKNNIVISENLAIKLFNTTENVIGKTLTWKHPFFEEVFQVSGIFGSPPANYTAQFDFIISMEVLLDHDRWAKEWTGNYAQTYLVIKEGADIKGFNKKIADFLKVKNSTNDKSTLFVQQYSTRYLYGHYENGAQAGGRIEYVQLFSFIALFILLIACINFMNLSTAKASQKMKEIGVKKAIGASRQALIYQYLGESILIACVSLIIAFLFVWLLLPQFNEIIGKHIHLALDNSIILTLVSIAVFTGFVSGCYPAFYLSGLNAITVLKGKLQTSSTELWVRKGLIIFQFTLSIIFIVGFLVINRQIKYTQTKNLGYDRDNILSFQWKGELYDQWNGLLEGKSNERFETFMLELKNIPGVVNATNMSGNILNEIYGQSGISWRRQESDKDYEFQSPLVGYDFIETLGIELKDGRSFSRKYKDEYSKIILNEAAVKLMDLQNPVGQSIQMNGESQVIGVVKDFHYGSLHNKIEPLIFRFSPGRNIMVKIKAGTEKTTIDQLKQLHNEFLSIYPFEFKFMDEDYQALYESEIRVAALSKYFAGLAILISCLGLFGLAAFTAQRRRKEIGIRKVLGSSEMAIIYLLSSEFTKMVLLSIAIALPLSYLIASQWLGRNFADSIELEWWYFALAGMVAVLITWLTVGTQAIKAAKVNPIQSLKDE